MTVQNVFKAGEGSNKTLSFKNTIPPSNMGGFDWSCIDMRPIKLKQVVEPSQNMSKNCPVLNGNAIFKVLQRVWKAH